MGLAALEKPPRAPSAPQGPSQQTAVREPGGKPSPDTGATSALLLDLPASGMGEIDFCCL